MDCRSRSTATHGQRHRRQYRNRREELALGNTVGVAQVDNQLKATQAAPEAKMYTVQKGDNLWKIAEAQYGKGQGAKNTLIFEANKPMLTSPTRSIRPGAAHPASGLNARARSE